MSTVREISGSSAKRSLRRTQARLDTWKEIAVYLRREVRTVQRWKRFEGLPVRHLFHKRASSVYAFADELDSWLETRSLAANSKSAGESFGAARCSTRNSLMRSGPRNPSSLRHVYEVVPRSAEFESVVGKKMEESCYAFSTQRRVSGKKRRPAQMSFFVTCHVSGRLAKSVQVNISLNLVPAGSAHVPAGLQNIPIENCEDEEDKHRELSN
jgi:hypothetical protein